MVEFEVSEYEEKQCWDGFHNDLFMTVDIDTESHWMQHSRTATQQRVSHFDLCLIVHTIEPERLKLQSPNLPPG